MSYSSFNPIFAEISDKMPGIGILWVFGVFLALIVVAGYRISPWSFAISGPFAILVAAAVCGESVADVDFRTAIIRELGYGYLAHNVCTGFLPVLAFLACAAYAIYRPRVEPSAPQNGGPTAQLGNSNITEGPPSVS